MLVMMIMKSTRSYTMRTRAESAAATRERIVGAGRDLLLERAGEPVTLEDIATRAGVSVPTVLRSFGSKGGALDVARELLLREMRSMRPMAPLGDVASAIALLYDEYEWWGDYVMRVLAAEYAHLELSEVLDEGRAWHRRWVETALVPVLGARGRKEQRALVDLLVVATDVYTWKLLRRDMQLSQRESTARVMRMIHALAIGP
jgi:AcrR family transcriptional regulator